MVILPIIALLLLLGMLTGTSLFALGASTFLIAIEGSRYFSRRWAESIVAQRRVPLTEVRVGESISVGLQTHNESGLWIPWTLIEDRLPQGALRLPPTALELTGEAVRLQSFRGHQSALMTYTLKTLRRGYFQIGPTIVETGDLLGFHRSYRVLTQPEYLTVLPKILSLEELDVASRRPMGDLRVEDRGLEDPTLLVGIRGYQSGDPMNRIHWKATARTGTLHTRIFQPTALQGAMLLVDMHEQTNPKANEPVRTDLAASAAASLAHTLYTAGQPFGLVSNGRDAADRMREVTSGEIHTDRDAAVERVDMRGTSSRLRPVVLTPDRTPEHFAEVHRVLARLERTSGLTLAQLISETESRLPRTLALVAILQQIDDGGALALAMLRRRGFRVAVVVNQSRDTYLETAAMLAAHRLPTLPLLEEASIPSLSQQWLLQGAIA